MKTWFFGFLATVSVAFAAGPVTTNALLNDAKQGMELALRLRDLAPAEDTSFRGVLIVETPRGDEREVPFTTAVALTNGGWRTTYEAQAGGKKETLAMRRKLDAPTLYTYSAPGEQPRVVPAADATNLFAGSDFALLDLGLEFFNWPVQVLVTREMRKGRGCEVLESRPSATNLYSRVLSWVDQETVANGSGVGLLMAEAYDASGKLLKQFEVRGFKKVAGRWQVKELEIRNRQRKTSTRLQFQFDDY